MRKFAFSFAAVLSIASVAMAGESDWYLNASGCNPAGAGENPTMYLAPATQLGGIYSNGTLSLNLDVNASGGGGCGDETISSLGMDMVASSANLSGTAWTTNNTAGSTGATNAPWSGFNAPAVGAGALVTDIRAVAVPAADADPLWNGYCPGVGYSVGALDVTATALTGGQEIVTIRMNVGLLKITRVGDPLGAPVTAPEMVSFGYDAGGSADTAFSGSSVGDGDDEGIDDATVIIRKKGDFGQFDPNIGFIPIPDGIVQLAEVDAFIAAVGTTDPELLFVGDFGQFDPNIGFIPVPDCIVQLAEVDAFISAVGS
jgi:hypothetical protein